MIRRVLAITAALILTATACYPTTTSVDSIQATAEARDACTANGGDFIRKVDGWGRETYTCDLSTEGATK